MNSIERDTVVQPLDDAVCLSASIFNKYETPAQGNFVIPHGTRKGHQGKEERIREVFRDLSFGQNYVQIHQWRDVPAGLEARIDSLPDHVKNFLRTEYTDPGVTPYDFNFPLD